MHVEDNDRSGLTCPNGTSTKTVSIVNYTYYYFYFYFEIVALVEIAYTHNLPLLMNKKQNRGASIPWGILLPPRDYIHDKKDTLLKVASLTNYDNGHQSSARSSQHPTRAH